MPRQPFVAEFVGLSSKLPATVRGGTADGLGIPVPLVDPATPPGAARALVRPEAVSLTAVGLGAGDPHTDPLVGQVIAIAFLGAVSRITVHLGEAGPVLAQLPTSQAGEFPAGTTARIAIRPDPVLVVRDSD